MATHRLSILGPTTQPDATGLTFMGNIFVEVATIHGSGLVNNMVMTMKDSAADTGFYGTFQVPQNYVGTPVIHVTGVLDGTIGTTIISFQIDYLPVADNETVDAGWGQQLIFNTADLDSGTAYTTEDLLTLTSGAMTSTLVVGDEVFYYFKRDVTADTFVGDFHLTGLYFQYSDA